MGFCDGGKKGVGDGCWQVVALRLWSRIRVVTGVSNGSSVKEEGEDRR